MKYGDIVRGIFLDRPNRFIADVVVDGRTERCHVKNTGRCRELLIPGTEVFLEHSSNTERATAFDLVTVNKSGSLVNIDSSIPNVIVRENAERIFGKGCVVRPEYTYDRSRLDFLITIGKRRILVEVKGVTLESGGIAMFPDAPTERGLKHIKELERALSDGYESMIVFVIQMSGMKRFVPNYSTHREFGEELENAVRMGVDIRAYGCDVTQGSVTLSDPVEILLGSSDNQ